MVITYLKQAENNWAYGKNVMDLFIKRIKKLNSNFVKIFKQICTTHGSLANLNMVFRVLLWWSSG